LFSEFSRIKIRLQFYAGPNLLEEAYVVFTLGVAEGFFSYNSPNLNGFERNLEYNCGATVLTRIKNLGKLPQGFHPLAPERCFVFFLSPIQRGLSDTYSALISTMFETTEVNRCAGTYTREKFPNFFVGVLQAPKTAPSGVHVTSIQLKQHNIFG